MVAIKEREDSVVASVKFQSDLKTKEETVLHNRENLKLNLNEILDLSQAIHKLTGSLREVMVDEPTHESVSLTDCVRADETVSFLNSKIDQLLKSKAVVKKR